MFYTEEHYSKMRGRDFRFLLTLKMKWKNFTTKNRA
jgi:hypothetical protein